jgi:hypothetical protein
MRRRDFLLGLSGGANPPRIEREVKELAAKGLVDPSLGATDNPLGFLVHDEGACDLVDAAYRYARPEPGVDVALFGTGSGAHLRSNVASLSQVSATGR